MTVIPCGVAIIRNGKEFLIAQRNADDSFGSFWEFPGGKKNSDETFEECVVREVKEETGIDIRVQKKFFEMKREYNERIIWLNFFICDYISGQPQALDCQKVVWASLDHLKDFNFPPANELVIDGLIKEYGDQNTDSCLNAQS